jgi:hypothetical protein
MSTNIRHEIFCLPVLYKKNVQIKQIQNCNITFLFYMGLRLSLSY